MLLGEALCIYKLAHMKQYIYLPLYGCVYKEEIHQQLRSLLRKSFDIDFNTFILSDNPLNITE